MTTQRQLQNLFLQQSCLDSWEDYTDSLEKTYFIRWDYVILTASNEAQADTYREQIAFRLRHGLLPQASRYVVLPDPEGKRVGSGGATFNVLRYIAEQENTGGNPFRGKRILVIHSGGDSKRVPQYSAGGKLFSPVPRELPNGQASTLFDETIIGMSGVPSRLKEGMLVLSGDVLLMFNPLQIDFQHRGAAAISFKEPVSTGKDHGVFLSDGKDRVAKFLHKQSEENLRALGAVNDKDCVDLDTGAVIMDAQLLNALYSLISTDGLPDGEKFSRFVSEESRVSFYGDFLYPLANDSTLEDYYREEAEGVINEALLECRKQLWQVLSPFSMGLLCLSPAKFIHFGTTEELVALVTEEVVDYEFLGWTRQVLTNAPEHAPYAAHNAYIGKRAQVEQEAYIENSYVLDDSRVGRGAVVSGVKLRGEQIPPYTVVHGLQLTDCSYVVRVYGIGDNPKSGCSGSFLGTTLTAFMEKNQLQHKDLWGDNQEYLWFARLYPKCDTQAEALAFAGILHNMAAGKASQAEIKRWKNSARLSLCASFNGADTMAVNAWQRELENRILASKFVIRLESGQYFQEAMSVFGSRGISPDVFRELMQDAENAEFGIKIRIYYAVATFMREHRVAFDSYRYDMIEAKCFDTIQNYIFGQTIRDLKSVHRKIEKERVDVQLPLRVNWGGGWTDTPPYCNEHGGVVLNAAIKLNGIYPVQITVKRLDALRVEFESTDVGVCGKAESTEEIQDCHNPYDPFALHKAALIACGIVPMDGQADLREILQAMGGGIYLSTQVVGVPKGSGLGTSSILSGACAKGLFEFMGKTASDSEIFEIVLCMEQIMSTGGGWQDQVGGLLPGIKFITTRPGVSQRIQVEQVELAEETKQELQERFALVYTGQRRLARNLLRDVVGSYIGARPESVQALEAMRRVAALMRFELEQGNIDHFASLMTEHWTLSKQLDAGSTNTCIDQMFLACEDLVDGKFISGAGGGGFLQVILKKGVSKTLLRDRLRAIFQDSGVDVWDCEFV